MAAFLWDYSATVRRRKLTFELLDDLWHRRRLSLDYEFSESLVKKANDEGLTRSVPIPLALPLKMPAHSLAFDVTGTDGAPLSLPTMEAAIAAIQQEVEDAEGRAAEAERERSALVDAAGPKIQAIEAKIAVLREVSD